MYHEEKLIELGKTYEKKKELVASRKGALTSTLERLKAEHGVETADEAKALIVTLEAKVTKWEAERDDLMNKISAGLEGQAVQYNPAEDDFQSPEEDDFDDFEE